RVVSIETVLQLTLLASTAFATYGTPVQDNLVADGNIGHTFTNFRNHGGGFVTQQVRVVIAHATFNVRIVGVANTAGQHIYDDFTGTGIRDDDRFDGDRSVLGPNDSGLNFMRHSLSFI